MTNNCIISMFILPSLSSGEDPLVIVGNVGRLPMFVIGDCVR